jgi:basic membrane protein A
VKVKRLGTLIIVILVVSFLISGCGAPAEEGNNEQETSGKNQIENAEKKYKVAMILETNVNDGGWGYSCYQGIKAAADKYGWEVSYTENVENADFASTFTEYANLGFDMVFAPGNQYQDAILEVAPNYPDVSFAILNGLVHTENVCSLQYDNTMVGFIAGMLAGLKTQTNACCALAAVEITSALEMSDGFKQGVLHVNPDAEVFVSYTGSFNDVAKGKELALSMINMNNVDVFLGLASAADVGMREATLENDCWSVAQPSNGLMDQAPNNILGCIVIDNARLLGTALEKVMDGTFGNEIIKGGLDDGVVYLGQMGVAASDIEGEFLEYVEQLKAGEIQVLYNY